MHTITTLVVGLGALAAVQILDIGSTDVPDPVIELDSDVASWCLGRRSKAQRLAYWRERKPILQKNPSLSHSQGTVTFNQDVAPILFEHCSGCHRPGEITPFSVLSFSDVYPWAWLIGVVTATRYMPPWPPETVGHLRFKDERRLSDKDIGTIKTWIEQGAQEGDASHLPPLPREPSEWILGKPDLVVELPGTYILPSDTKGDIYRNFVLPVPLDSARWVKAVQIKPGSKQVVHHAIMQVDRVGAARRLDAQDKIIGFDGMDLGGAENPGGHFIGWAPGKTPTIAPEDMPWSIEPGTDLVLQLHMLPNGLTENIRPRVGLYFTDQPAKRQPFGIFLRSSKIDIAPGKADYTVEKSLTLPVDVTVLGIFPHAHYIGRDIWAGAHLPDGNEITLIHIKHWDFGWQDEYRYKKPVLLPAGTQIKMRFVYDNSEDNPRNPNNPPKRVTSGNLSTDEMAILMLQVIPKGTNGEALIREAVARERLQTNPDNWLSHNLLGVSLRMQNRNPEAINHFLKAQTLNPNYDTILYNLANAYQADGQLNTASATYKKLIAQSPQHPKAHNNYGVNLQSLGKHVQAKQHFQRQLDLSPKNSRTLFNLAISLRVLGSTSEARGALKTAIKLDPNLHAATLELADLERTKGNYADAKKLYTQLIDKNIFRGLSDMGLGLAWLAEKDREKAKQHLKTAIDFDQSILQDLNHIAWSLATNPETRDRFVAEAIFIAELINIETSDHIPEFVDTLAAAYAADRRFEDAMSSMRQALDLLSSGHKLRSSFQERLVLYSNQQIYVQP